MSCVADFEEERVPQLRPCIHWMGDERNWSDRLSLLAHSDGQADRRDRLIDTDFNDSEEWQNSDLPAKLACIRARSEPMKPVELDDGKKRGKKPDNERWPRARALTTSKTAGEKSSTHTLSYSCLKNIWSFTKICSSPFWLFYLTLEGSSSRSRSGKRKGEEGEMATPRNPPTQKTSKVN